jgi:hypothetical protein
MITLNNGKLFIDHEEVLKNSTSFKRLFPFAQWRKNHWEVAATPSNIEIANNHYNAEIFIETRRKIEDGNITEFLNDNDHPFKIKPYRHQLEALTACNNADFFAYFMEPGLGKTKTLIDDVMLNGNIDSVLIICPKSVISVWEREILANGEGSIGAWPEEYTNDGVRWYVINHDALISEKGMNMCKTFLQTSSHSMMVLDESTFIANHKSQRAEACMKLGNYAEYRRILTGDPIANTPIDLYSQLYWLSPECVKNRGFYAFRNHFCDMGGFKNKQIVGYKNMLELKVMVNKHGYRARTKDVLDMPEQNWLTREVSLSDSSKRLYDRIVEEEIISLFDFQSTVSAAIILTKMMKLQQVCGGTIKDDNGESHVVGTEKLDELKSMLLEWNVKGVLVWHQFRKEGEEIVKELSKRYETRLFNGDLKNDERKRMIAEFERGEIDVLVIQNDAGHLGITLNKATYAVYFSNHMRPVVRSQSERRCWRIGQTQPVFYYDLLCGKIDKWVYDRVKRKRRFNLGITDNMTKEEVMNAIR